MENKTAEDNREKPDKFICDECKFTRPPHEHRCLDPNNCNCSQCNVVKEFRALVQFGVPVWVIEYDVKNFQSSAGRGIRELLNVIKDLRKFVPHDYRPEPLLPTSPSSFIEIKQK